MSDLFMNMQRQRLSTTLAARRGEHVDSFTSDASTQSHNANVSNAAAAAADDDEEEEPFANILSLKLRKPKNWKWELSTSRSCSNIALPRILLYDHKGTLLVDADSQQEQVYSQPNKKEKPKQHNSYQHAATVNLAHNIRQLLDAEFKGLQIAEATPSPYTSNASTPAPEQRLHANSIDFNTFELPDFRPTTHYNERRSSSLKGVRFKDDYKYHHNSMEMPPTPPSTTTTTATTTPTTPSTSSTNGRREKQRRYRRTQSSSRSPAPQPESILERFSLNRGRFSSPEYAEQQDVYRAPRYYLSTSKAGTLIVQEDSFSRYRRRRRTRRHSSSENVTNASPQTQSVHSSTRSVNKQHGDNDYSMNVSNDSQEQKQQQRSRSRSRRRSQQPIRRYCSDGNMLINPMISSSDEDCEQHAEAKAADMSRHLQPYIKRKSKRDLVRLDSGVSSSYTGR